MISTSTVQLARISALSWLAFAIAAVLALRVPFTGDQYFFALGAEALARGDRLYIDFWDIKQPGIFYVYRLAALLPGDLVVGVRVIEVACWLFACELVRRILLQAGVERAIAAMVPAALGATFLAAAPAWHLSQIESFAVLPTVLCAAHASRSPARRVDWIVLGVGAAFIVWLKLVLVLIPTAMAAAMLWGEWRNNSKRQSGASVTINVMSAAGAFGLMLALLLAPFSSRESIAALLEVTWQYPTQQMQSVADAPASRLALTLAWFMAVTAPLCLLACAGILFGRVSQTRRVALWWLAAVLLCIVLQRFSWWAYHTTLMRPAIVVLALLSVGAVSTWMPRIRPVAIVLFGIVVTIGISLSMLVRKASVIPDSIGTSIPSASYERAVAPGYELLREQADQLVRERGLGASLCVLGDTALAYHAQARCKMTLRMWSAPALSEEKWRQFATELRQAQPELIYLAGSEAEVLRQHQPAVLRWIDAEYRVLRPGMPRDSWYIRRDSESGS